MDGASKSRRSWLTPDASTSSTSPNLSAPSGRQIPDRPLSLASRVTRDAPASRSSLMYSAHIRGGSCSDRPGSLYPTSETSHELRTPLTSLRLNAELLAAEPGLPEPERREVLDRLVAQVAELGQLVASVTELARDESQPGPLGEVELHKVVEASLAGARRDWAQAIFTAELEPWTVPGSTDSLQVAVRNLVDNAAAPDGGALIRLRLPGRGGPGKPRPGRGAGELGAGHRAGPVTGEIP
jgi:hypothetical protein